MSDIEYPLKQQRGLQLKLIDKGHPIAERVFDTYESMMSYINNTRSTAVSGIILVVNNDSNEEGARDKNGAYLVQSINGDRDFTETEVVPLSTGDMRTYWDISSFK